MEDVVLFDKGTLEEWKSYKDDLDLFCSASGMSIRLDKSVFLFNNLNEEVRMGISAIFPFKKDPIELGFIYLGYRLKPLGYGNKDWRWIFKKFEKRISN